MITIRILIDADGCPVVDIAVRLATKTGLECLILCDTSHVFDKPGAKTLTFSKGADSVDFALVNLVKPGDIVITQDYGYPHFHKIRTFFQYAEGLGGWYLKR